MDLACGHLLKSRMLSFFLERTVSLWHLPHFVLFNRVTKHRNRPSNIFYLSKHDDKMDIINISVFEIVEILPLDYSDWVHYHSFLGVIVTLFSSFFLYWSFPFVSWRSQSAFTYYKMNTYCSLWGNSALMQTAQRAQRSEVRVSYRTAL